MDALTPREIVQELDKYIVGQDNAKRAVAIALRNRWRRQQLPPELRDEVAPKNIIMIGPTGVGKTEIARRLARLPTDDRTRGVESGGRGDHPRRAGRRSGERRHVHELRAPDRRSVFEVTLRRYGWESACRRNRSPR